MCVCSEEMWRMTRTRKVQIAKEKKKKSSLRHAEKERKQHGERNRDRS